MTTYTTFLLLLKLMLKNYKIDYITEICDNYEDCFLHWYTVMNGVNKERKLHFSKIFSNYIKESNRLDAPYIIFPIVLHDSNSIYEYNDLTNLNLKHLVVFLYNKKRQIMEYFDPTDNKKCYDTLLLKDVFLKYNIVPIKHFIQVNEYKPKEECGIQGMQERELDEKEKILGETYGLCAIYVMWYINKRLSTDIIDPNEMLRIEMNKFKTNRKDNLTRMILIYKNYLEQTCKLNIKLIKENHEHYEEYYSDICMIIDLIHINDELNQKNENFKNEDQSMDLIW